MFFFFYILFLFFLFFFFFQAEDGIRDRNVTGVQTCALPIFSGLCLLWIAVSAVKLVLQKRELLKSDLRSPVIVSVAAQVADGQNEQYVVPSRFGHFSSLSVPRKFKMKRVFRWLAILLSIIALAFTDVTYSLLIPPDRKSTRLNSSHV